MESKFQYFAVLEGSNKSWIPNLNFLISRAILMQFFLQNDNLYGLLNHKNVCYFISESDFRQIGLPLYNTVVTKYKVITKSIMWCQSGFYTWWGVLDTTIATLCDNVCQRLAACHWSSLCTPGPPTNKTDCNDITEILLKVALNIITPTLIREYILLVLEKLSKLFYFCILWLYCYLH